jgi:predicted nucleotidyltransferase
MRATEFIYLQSSLKEIFERNRVKQVIVFGSAARQTATRKSDLDLMIIMETEKRFFDRYEAFDQVFYLIKDKSIDLLIYTPEELERISSRPFIRTILKEGRILYEHGE